MRGSFTDELCRNKSVRRKYCVRASVFLITALGRGCTVDLSALMHCILKDNTDINAVFIYV